MEGDLHRTVGANLRTYRQERGLSQEAMTDVLGVHRTYLHGRHRTRRTQPHPSRRRTHCRSNQARPAGFDAEADHGWMTGRARVNDVVGNRSLFAGPRDTRSVAGHLIATAHPRHGASVAGAQIPLCAARRFHVETVERGMPIRVVVAPSRGGRWRHLQLRTICRCAKKISHALTDPSVRT